MIETHLDGKSMNLVEDNISKLKEIFPEIVTEGKINFDMLKEILGEEIEVSNELYNFTWPGKSQSIQESFKTSQGTLIPCKEESKNWDSTKNLYIEGDNLEVLKLLQKSYNNKVKMIYIDPPYNTGNDFVYKDDYKDNTENYLRFTGQVDEEGKKLSTNTESNGRFHTDWLNMMYPRLKLARNLLTDDGVIFISIDDHELENLKKICNEIFGEENIIGNIVWHKKTQPSFLSKEISNVKEYVLLYKKNSDKIVTKGGLTDVNKKIEMINISNAYSKRTLNKENVIIKNENYNGVLKKGTYGNGNLKIDLFEDISVKSGKPDKDLLLNGRFKWTQEKMNESFEEGDKYIVNPESLRPVVDKVNKVANVKPILDLFSKKINKDIATNTDATNELKKLFDGISPMDYPKPSKLIKYLIDSITYDDKDAIILDFFSGSGTTAHATFLLNNDDSGNRKFIMVQLPEETDKKSDAYKLGFTNIFDLGKERIRRAGNKIVEESGNDDLDIGFKVFKLNSSNLTKWNPDVDNLEQSLLSAEDNLVEGRSELDLVYEIMLKDGYDLTWPVEKLEDGFYSVAHGSLMICLSDNIDLSINDKILKLSEEYDILKVIFKDNGFESDVVKANIKETLRLAKIEKFETI